MPAPESHLSVVWESRDGSWSHGTKEWEWSTTLSWASIGHQTEAEAAAAREGSRGYRVYSASVNADVEEVDRLDVQARRITTAMLARGEDLFEWE